MNFSFETVIENDNCAVTGLFHIKVGRNMYNMGGNTEGKSLIFISGHY